MQIACPRCTGYSSVTGVRVDEADGDIRGPQKDVLPSEAYGRNKKYGGRLFIEVKS